MTNPEWSWSDWTRRASKYLEPKDLWRLSLGGVLSAAVRLAVARDRDDDPDAGIARRDPEFAEIVLDLSRALGRQYFRWRCEGVENVPASGPALLVGSHNGGIVTFDSLLTIVAIRDHHGPQRVVHPLAHDLVFQDPRFRQVAEWFGALRAGHRSAAAAFRAGRLVLVYPGSDLDSTRAWRDRHRIELGGRMGFLKLALRERVPIVPVVSVGTHEQFVVLTRGEQLARSLGLKKWFRVEVFPIVFSLPWGVTSGFLPYIPLPAQTTVAFGEPIRFDEIEPSQADEPDVLARCYETVRTRMQDALDRIAVGRVPLYGQL